MLLVVSNIGTPELKIILMTQIQQNTSNIRNIKKYIFL